MVGLRVANLGLYISFGDWAIALECSRSPTLRTWVFKVSDLETGHTRYCSISGSDPLQDKRRYDCRRAPRIVFVTGTVVISIKHQPLMIHQAGFCFTSLFVWQFLWIQQVELKLLNFDRKYPTFQSDIAVWIGFGLVGTVSEIVIQKLTINVI